ncbi:MAG: HAMP domain-containing protein, partial [Tepidimonas taiwanensis]|nr:HAMP domain-containing protein [Tepidimonas taiwanensis]
MAIRDLKIGVRLGLGFGLLLALLLAVAIGGIVGGLRMQAVEETVKTYNKAAMLAEKWSAFTRQQVDRTVAVARLGENPQALEYFQTQIAQTRALVDELQQRTGAAVDQLADAEASRLLQLTREARGAQMRLRDQVLERVRAGDHTGARALADGEYRRAGDRYVQAQEDLAQYLVTDAERTIEEANRFVGNLSLAMGAAAALALLIGVTVAVSLTRGIVRPLREAVGIAQAVAHGDLTQTIHVDRGDEVGELMRALQQMQAALQQAFQRIRASADQVALASAEIAQGNQDLSARTENAAASVEETSASLQQLTEAVRSSSQAAAVANQLAAQAADAA